MSIGAPNVGDLIRRNYTWKVRGRLMECFPGLWWRDRRGMNSPGYEAAPGERADARAGAQAPLTGRCSIARRFIAG